MLEIATIGRRKFLSIMAAAAIPFPSVFINTAFQSPCLSRLTVLAQMMGDRNCKAGTDNFAVPKRVRPDREPINVRNLLVASGFFGMLKHEQGP